MVMVPFALLQPLLVAADVTSLSNADEVAPAFIATAPSNAAISTAACNCRCLESQTPVSTPRPQKPTSTGMQRPVMIATLPDLQRVHRRGSDN